MENSSNVQGLKLQDKYLLTSKETGAYFNNEKLLFFITLNFLEFFLVLIPLVGPQV